MAVTRGLQRPRELEPVLAVPGVERCTHPSRLERPVFRCKNARTAATALIPHSFSNSRVLTPSRGIALTISEVTLGDADDVVRPNR